jgi:hypothetical protein
MEKKGMEVVGGYLSPSHDMYVGAKMRRVKSFHIDFKHRLQLCQLACKDSDWYEFVEKVQRH